MATKIGYDREIWTGETRVTQKLRNSKIFHLLNIIQRKFDFFQRKMEREATQWCSDLYSVQGCGLDPQAYSGFKLKKSQ